MNLPSLATVLTAWRSTAMKASEALKAYAAEHPNEPAAQTALAAAADIDSALNELSVINITNNALDELKSLALTGKSIVHHASTDTF